MAIEIRTGIKCEYQCDTCGIGYIEQRNLGESQFVIECQKYQCTGTYQLVNETEFTYEQKIPDPIDKEPATEEPIEEPIEE